MTWHFHLPDWVTIDQNTRDPNTPDHSVNCGFAATAAMGRWATGRHFDPERIRVEMGEPVDENTGSGVEVDRWFFGPDGPVPLRDIEVFTPGDKNALAWRLYTALSAHHPIKVLQWYDENQVERHWRVVHAGRRRQDRILPEYLSGDPWIGVSIVQTLDELWTLNQGMPLVIPIMHRHLERG